MDAIGEQQPKRTRSGAAVEADTIGDQQPKQTRSGAAAEADASDEHAAAAEAGAIGEQQLEADANGEQQLKRMQSGPGAAADSKRQAAADADAIEGQVDAIGVKQTQSGSSNSAQRAVRHLITHGRQTRGK